jgi:uncharacterized phage protein (TIGR01671 family)
MREYLFRGQRTDAGRKWCYGNLQERNGHFAIYEKTHFSDTPKGYYVGHAIYPETVGQYTGLDDKNQKKIFEGDIIKDEQGSSGVVLWVQEDASFFYGESRERCDCIMRFQEYKIIGNIHDTPELLGGEGKEK